MELSVFAKIGSKEKFAMVCSIGLTRIILERLNKELGGDWVKVDSVKLHEGIFFSDETIYKGFISNDIRYSDAIKKVF